MFAEYHRGFHHYFEPNVLDIDVVNENEIFQDKHRLCVENGILVYKKYDGKTLLKNVYSHKCNGRKYIFQIGTTKLFDINCKLIARKFPRNSIITDDFTLISSKGYKHGLYINKRFVKVICGEFHGYDPDLNIIITAVRMIYANVLLLNHIHNGNEQKFEFDEGIQHVKVLKTKNIMVIDKNYIIWRVNLSGKIDRFELDDLVS